MGSSGATLFVTFCNITSRRTVSNVDVLTYAGNLANLDGVVEEHGERYEFFKADIANADQMDTLLTRATLLRHHQFRRRIARRSQHQFPAKFHSHQRRRHERPARCRPPPRRPALHPGLDRRSLRVVRRDRKIHRAIAARAQLALFREQSRRRPPRARLPPHLRPGRHRHPLLEQLRPLPIPGEIDPAHDHQGAATISRCRFTATG